MMSTHPTEAASLRLGRHICGKLGQARRREWLCTNNLGSYAMGSVAGTLERSYHGLLVEASAAPLGRLLRLACLLPRVELPSGVQVELDTMAWCGPAWSGGQGRWLESFHLEGRVAVWTFLVHGHRLERAVWMIPGQDTTVVRWRLIDGGFPVKVHLKALGSARNHHHTDPWGERPAPQLALGEGGQLEVRYPKARTLRLVGGAWSLGGGDLYRNFWLSLDEERGLGCSDAHRHFGDVTLELVDHQPVYVLASMEHGPLPSGEEAWSLRQEHDRALLQQRAGLKGAQGPRAARLVLAADDFVVERPVQGERGLTVIAGYPWFGDWGRDTMIALPGLLLRTGRAQEAARVLRTFARFVDQGMLPNRFPGAHEPPEYNTVDATLWYFVAAQRTLRALPAQEAQALGAELLPVLEQIVVEHLRGTRYDIGVDSDGLLSSGQEGVQLTWMDARVDGEVITPRRGKPVEINGLWIHALQVLLDLRQAHGQQPGPLLAQLQRARQAFARYWCEESGCLKDVLDVPGGGNDNTVRPNQIIALSLESCPLSLDRRRQALRVAGEALLTSHGLRSLSPQDPRYVGSYAGPPAHRDGCYHQGTTWGWLVGPWARARLLVGDAPRAVRHDLEPLLDHLGAGLLGSVSEIFDGDPPFTPRGAPAQAWSVAELLDALDAVERAASQEG